MCRPGLRPQWAPIYGLKPVTSARFHEAFNPSGAKDDFSDAKRHLTILVRLTATPARSIFMAGMSVGYKLTDNVTASFSALVPFYSDSFSSEDTMDPAPTFSLSIARSF